MPQQALPAIDYRSIPLFSELDEAELEHILSFCSVKRFAKGTIIFRETEPYVGFYVVLRGNVKVFRHTQDGKELILHLLNPPSLMAEVPMFEGVRYPACSMAMENSELLFVPKEEFTRYLDSSPRLMRKMMIGLAKKVRLLSDKLEGLSLHDVTSRLAKYLLEEIRKVHREELAQPFIRLQEQKSVIAAQLGTARETLSRSLKRLQSSNIVSIKGRTLTVLDYARLREIAQ